jgi:hypothetical protein
VLKETDMDFELQLEYDLICSDDSEMVIQKLHHQVKGMINIESEVSATSKLKEIILGRSDSADKSRTERQRASNPFVVRTMVNTLMIFAVSIHPSLLVKDDMGSAQTLLKFKRDLHSRLKTEKPVKGFF